MTEKQIEKADIEKFYSASLGANHGVQVRDMIK